MKNVSRIRCSLVHHLTVELANGGVWLHQPGRPEWAGLALRPEEAIELGLALIVQGASSATRTDMHQEILESLSPPKRRARKGAKS